MTSDLKASVISGMKWLAVSKATIQLFRWASTFWVIRILNAEDYGVMAIVEIMAALLIAINYLCIGNVIIRFKTISKPIMNTLFTCCLIIGFLLFTVQFLSSFYFAQFYNTAEAESVLQVIAVVYLIECFNVKPMALMAKNMQFAKLAKIDLISGLSMPIAVLVCAYMGMGYWAIAIGHIVNASMKTFVANVLFPTSMALNFRFKRTFCILKFGLQNTASSVLAQINSSLDFIIGGYFFSTATIGIYQVGLQISFLPLRKISPELRRISFPAYSKINNDFQKITQYHIKSNRLISLIIFPLFWGLGFISEPLVSLVLTDKWLESATIIKILCFILPFKLLAELSGSMLNAIGRADILLTNTLFSAVVYIIAIVFLIDVGIQGLAYAWVISILLSYMSLIYRITKILPMRLMEIIGSYKEALQGGTIMIFSLFCISLLFNENTPLTLSIYIITGACSYSGYIFLFKKNVLIELKHLIKS
ncbi:MAG: lipopolysaccharide biosynthesis protein [Colwellia sp.]